MSRKEFELIARALKETQPGKETELSRVHSSVHGQWCVTTLRLAMELKTTNPQFNQERFLRACGY